MLIRLLGNVQLKFYTLYIFYNKVQKILSYEDEILNEKLNDSEHYITWLFLVPMRITRLTLPFPS